MWYFSWILGVGFAGAFSILNAMWLELHETRPIEARDDDRDPR
jgi:cyd operon protein YbgT